MVELLDFLSTMSENKLLKMIAAGVSRPSRSIMNKFKKFHVHIGGDVQLLGLQDCFFTSFSWRCCIERREFSAITVMEAVASACAASVVRGSHLHFGRSDDNHRDVTTSSSASDVRGSSADLFDRGILRGSLHFICHWRSQQIKDEVSWVRDNGHENGHNHGDVQHHSKGVLWLAVQAFVGAKIHVRFCPVTVSDGHIEHTFASQTVIVACNAW